MAATPAERTAKRRAALRAQGLRPVTLWVPDTRNPEVRAEIRRQCQLIADHDRANADFLRDMDGWLALSAEAVRAGES